MSGLEAWWDRQDRLLAWWRTRRWNDCPDDHPALGPEQVAFLWLLALGAGLAWYARMFLRGWGA